MGDLAGYGVCGENIWTQSKMCQKDKPTVDILWQIYPGLFVPPRKTQKS